EDPALVGELRDWLWSGARIRASLIAGKHIEGAKYRDYFDHIENIGSIPSHRLLALYRARNEGVLSLDLAPMPNGAPKVIAADAIETTIAAGHAEAAGRVAAHAGI